MNASRAATFGADRINGFDLSDPLVPDPQRPARSASWRCFGYEPSTPGAGPPSRAGRKKRLRNQRRTAPGPTP